MIFIELFVPKGSLHADQRRQISQRLITELMVVENAPPGVIEAGLAISQVVVHEPEQWIVGGQPFAPTEAPRYVVRVTVPAAWRNEMSAHLITTLTRVLAEADKEPQRLYQEPHAWIHVMGVPEGSCGAFGRVMKSTDITKLITRPFREAVAESLPIRELAPGTAIDPICGMVVSLTGDSAITMEHDGAIYAFCCQGCRAVFIEEVQNRRNTEEVRTR